MTFFVEWVYKEKFFDKGCFIAQQAGEKALKACLYGCGERRVIGHSLFELAEALSLKDVSFQEVIKEAKRLDRFYIPTRYPNGLPGGCPFQIFTFNDFSEAYQDLQKIMNTCKMFLEKLKITFE
ncbi:MAG: HEPN domain-containing protein [Desulfobacterota bacterium]|nr:HEPN domain-containing protein [Thermodesulfobacteriota bacterium]